MASSTKTRRTSQIEEIVEPDHWSERGRATSVGSSNALGRPRRSVPALGHMSALGKFFGRVGGALVRGRSQHLMDIAPLLGFSHAEMKRLAGLEPEAREAEFLSIIEHRHGGPVDWRGTPEDIYEILLPCLAADERGHLPDVGTIQRQPPARVVQALDSHLGRSSRALRAIESFGDFFIVLLVPRERVAEFDRIARHWIA
jgi:hypothetical protein